MKNNKNVLLATVLSASILILWTWFYEKPRMEKFEAEQKILAQKEEKKSKASPEKNSSQNISNSKTLEKSEISYALVNRKEALEGSKKDRIEIKSEELHGSIYLKGARFDDLTLVKYQQTIDPKSSEVVLLSPANSNERYFVDFGWISSNSDLDLPKPDTIWLASSNSLTPEKPVTLTWKNKQNILFSIKIALDENYMFSVSQAVKNLSGSDIILANYGRVNRVMPTINKSNYILHEGPIGAFDGILQEINYQELSEEETPEQNFNAKDGWLGITDKYWLTSLIPDKNLPFKGRFSYNLNNQNNIFDVEFVGQELKVGAGEELKFNHNLFAGAKKVKLLDEYSKKYDIALFDRSVDFGWFYFLTKPFFFLIKFLSGFFGNFGLAILSITILIKLLMFPLASKSYGAIAKIKRLQPKIEKIREATKDDKMKMNREIMEFYKKEKVNPTAGCLPMLIQIPVFFSLYKVLYITIDMRHAPFYGWIKDLSAPDPTSIFNLFGLLPFEVYGIFNIGIWPILMGITMIIQQKVSPQPTDPTQAKVMKLLPYFLIFVFAAFPAGLLIYWTWSNILSIAQQWYINKKHEKDKD